MLDGLQGVVFGLFEITQENVSVAYSEICYAKSRPVTQHLRRSFGLQTHLLRFFELPQSDIVPADLQPNVQQAFLPGLVFREFQEPLCGLFI